VKEKFSERIFESGASKKSVRNGAFGVKSAQKARKIVPFRGCFRAFTLLSCAFSLQKCIERAQFYRSSVPTEEMETIKNIK
jgi:hypothetical protein